MLYPGLTSYIHECEARFDSIPVDRKTRLAEVTAFVREQAKGREKASLTFICTHNSRRSHFAQLWAQVAVAHHGIPNVATFSGGTEATAFNFRAVAALQRAGLRIVQTTDDTNPVYEVRYDDDLPAMTAFSKVYNHAPNPTDGYCAVMTCSQADEACPVVLGAAKRVAIPYLDPKNEDGTDRETSAYDDRCRQIATEMLYLFSLI